MPFDEMLDFGIELFEKMKFKLKIDIEIFETAETVNSMENDSNEESNMENELNAMRSEKPSLNSKSLREAIISVNKDDERVKLQFDERVK